MQCTFKHTLEMGFYNGTFYEILMGFKQQNGDLTGLSHFSHLYLGYKGTIMEFKTNKMTFGYLQKGYILYIPSLWELECGKWWFISGFWGALFSDKGIFWWKTLFSSKYAQQNQSIDYSDYGFCMFWSKHVRCTWTWQVYWKNNIINTWSVGMGGTTCSEE